MFDPFQKVQNQNNWKVVNLTGTRVVKRIPRIQYPSLAPCHMCTCTLCHLKNQITFRISHPHVALFLEEISGILLVIKLNGQINNDLTHKSVSSSLNMILTRVESWKICLVNKWTLIRNIKGSEIKKTRLSSVRFKYSSHHDRNIFILR